MKKLTCALLISVLLFVGCGCESSNEKSKQFVNQINRVMETSGYITRNEIASLFPQIKQGEINVFGNYSLTAKTTNLGSGGGIILPNENHLEYSLTLTTLEQFKGSRYEGYVSEIEYKIDNTKIAELVKNALLEKNIENEKYDLDLEENIRIVLKDNLKNEMIAEANKQKEETIKANEEKKAEAERKRSEGLKNTIRVYSVNTTTPNLAGGVDFYIKWTNTSNKIIKYIIFTVEPYNAVNDVVTCEIRGTSTYNGKVTGPVEPGEGNEPGYHWENAWYNNTITNAKLKSVEIEYMDGSQKSIGYSDMEYIIY